MFQALCCMLGSHHPWITMEYVLQCTTSQHTKSHMHISSLPSLVTGPQKDHTRLFRALLSMHCWTYNYFLQG